MAPAPKGASKAMLQLWPWCTRVCIFGTLVERGQSSRVQMWILYMTAWGYLGTRVRPPKSWRLIMKGNSAVWLLVLLGEAHICCVLTLGMFVLSLSYLNKDKWYFRAIKMRRMPKAMVRDVCAGKVVGVERWESFQFQLALPCKQCLVLKTDSFRTFASFWCQSQVFKIPPAAVSIYYLCWSDTAFGGGSALCSEAVVGWSLSYLPTQVLLQWVWIIFSRANVPLSILLFLQGCPDVVGIHYTSKWEEVGGSTIFTSVTFSQPYWGDGTKRNHKRSFWIEEKVPFPAKETMYFKRSKFIFWIWWWFFLRTCVWNTYNISVTFYLCFKIWLRKPK